MTISIFHDAAVLEQLFQERYRRPPPWFEVTGPGVAEELAWKLSACVGVVPATGDLGKVLEFAWDRMPGRKRSDVGEYIGATEPLSLAAARLGVPRDGVVHLWHHWFQHGDRGGGTVRLRMRDLVEFEGLLWEDDCWAIDEEARWVLVGTHDWPAYLWQFGGARQE